MPVPCTMLCSAMLWPPTSYRAKVYEYLIERFIAPKVEVAEA